MKQIITISIPKERFRQKVKQANGTKISHRVVLPTDAGKYKSHVLLISEDFVQEDLDNPNNNLLHFYADRDIRLSKPHRIPNTQEFVYETVNVSPEELYKNIYGKPIEKRRARYSDEEIEFMKKNISVLDFLKEHAGLAFSRQGLKWYRCEQHSSLVVDVEKNIMYWNSAHINGSAIEYLTKAEGYSFPEAMQILVDYHNGLAPDKKRYVAPKYEQIEFVLPESEKNVSKIYKYLCEDRKIDRDLVKRFVDDGKIFLDGKGNCVFACTNSKGVVDSAFLRSTYSGFRGNTAGGNKFTGFYIEMNPNAKKLVLTEAFIDGLSYISAKRKLGEEVDFNVLACDSCNVLNETFRRNYLTRKNISDNIDTLVIATDNDKAGIHAAEELKEFVKPFYRIKNVIEDLPGIDSDWNKDLQKMYEKNSIENINKDIMMKL